MKKVLFAVAMLVSALGAYAQGTVGWANVTDPARGLHKDVIGGVAPAAGSFTVGLYYSATQNGTFSLISTKDNAANGLWVASTGTTGNDVAGGGTAWFQIKAWDKTAGSFEAALTKGSSATFTSATGGAGSPPSSPVNIFNAYKAANANGLIVETVPEPTTLAFGALGLGAAILLRRRK